MAVKLRHAILGLVAFAGCASKYAYTFHLTEPGVRAAATPGGPETLEDADVRADIVVDPVADAIVLGLTNKTDQVLQVEWSQITITRGDGRVTSMRPDVDLGWIQPSGNVAARLFAISLPKSGDAAARNEGQRFQLDVPVIVRRERKLYRYSLTAHVREL